MKQFRYVIKWIAYEIVYEWQNCKDVTVEKMNSVAEQLNKDYGNDWYVEYRG